MTEQMGGHTSNQRPEKADRVGFPTVQALVDAYADENPADDHAVGCQGVAEVAFTAGRAAAFREVAEWQTRREAMTDQECKEMVIERIAKQIAFWELADDDCILTEEEAWSWITVNRYTDDYLDRAKIILSLKDDQGNPLLTVLSKDQRLPPWVLL